jgi:predicted P-loop ATPase
MLALRGHWVVELAEVAAMRKSEIEHVKSFLTSQIDSYRPPFGRVAVNVPRQCIFVATTNDAFFLTDMTGNRRFWPVTVGKVIDTAGLKAAMPSLLAAAFEALESGEALYMEGDDAASALAQAEAYTAGDELMGMVTTYLSGRNEVSLTEVWRFALKNEAASTSAFTRAEQNRVRQIVLKAGWRGATDSDGVLFTAGPRKGHRRWLPPVEVSDPVRYGPEGEANKAGLHVVK